MECRSFWPELTLILAKMIDIMATNFLTFWWRSNFNDLCDTKKKKFISHPGDFSPPITCKYFDWLICQISYLQPLLFFQVFSVLLLSWFRGFASKVLVSLFLLRSFKFFWFRVIGMLFFLLFLIFFLFHFLTLFYYFFPFIFIGFAFFLRFQLLLVFSFFRFSETL